MEICRTFFQILRKFHEISQAEQSVHHSIHFFNSLLVANLERREQQPCRPAADRAGEDREPAAPEDEEEAGWRLPLRDNLRRATAMAKSPRRG